ncbi:MAG: hypothetical protein MUP97_07745 [Acidimicrobiia bacterium]|nr:hypothetical protein [Acidimicrobiia bacterium]
MTLSRPQLDALRYAKGHMIFAADINGGDGNRRRTLLSLLKIGMLDWDPICHGRLVLTAAGEEQLTKDRDRKHDARAKLGAISRPPDPPRAAVPEPRWWWNGLCPAGTHGLDFEGQRCDLCPPEERP